MRTFDASETWTLLVTSFPVTRAAAYFVEVLQDIEYPAFNLGLSKASWGRVKSQSLRTSDGR